MMVGWFAVGLVDGVGKVWSRVCKGGLRSLQLVHECLFLEEFTHFSCSPLSIARGVHTFSVGLLVYVIRGTHTFQLFALVCLKALTHASSCPDAWGRIVKVI